MRPETQECIAGHLELPSFELGQPPRRRGTGGNDNGGHHLLYFRALVATCRCPSVGQAIPPATLDLLAMTYFMVELSTPGSERTNDTARFIGDICGTFARIVYDRAGGFETCRFMAGREEQGAVGETALKANVDAQGIIGHAGFVGRLSPGPAEALKHVRRASSSSRNPRKRLAPWSVSLID